MEKLQQYELLIDNNRPCLRNIFTGKIEYEIVCIDSKETLIRVKGLIFEDSIKMYVTNIKNFNSTEMLKLLPECYI